MKSWTEQKLYTTNHSYMMQYISSEDLFLDIETTGLSKSKNHIYLIGVCQIVDNNKIIVNQWFAENISDELNILSAFLDFLTKSSIKRIITFNGNSFDLPFLSERAARNHLSLDFSIYELFDIYKEARRLKNILLLPDYKQKTIEQFLGIKREDLYNGGELIQVYKKIVKTMDSEQLAILKLHNYEDVLGMPDLLPLFSYLSFIQQKPSILSVDTEEYHDLDDKICLELIVELDSTYSLPGTIHARHSYTNTYLFVKNHKIILRLPITDGKLRYYYPDYKNYYYLPLEGTAIHKSVAAYVDASHREKATPETCYTTLTCTKDFLHTEAFSDYIHHVLESYL